MTDGHLDEQIRNVINQTNEQEKIDNQNIYEGVTINDRYYEFKEMAFFEDQLKIHIPTSFVDMPPELARIKYPSGDRPQIIKSNETGSINITLNRIPNTVNDKQIPQVKEGIKTILKRLNPSYLFFEEGVETIQGKTIGYFEFKSPAIDASLFNFMFVMELSHDVMMGNVSCPYEEHPAWRPVARQIMQSVRDTGMDPQSAGGQQE